MKPETLLTLILASATLTACGPEFDASIDDDSFRAVIVTDTWELHGPASLPDVNSCVDYWNDRCASLTPSQCAIAQNRYTCSDSSVGVVVTDNFGALANAVAWEGYSVGDAGLSTSDTIEGLCESMQGLDYEECLTLAAAAEAVAADADTLITKFPFGGFGQLTIRDDVFVVDPGGNFGEELDYAVADALDWRVPMIPDTCGLGPANGASFGTNVMVDVRPNGTISVSNSRGAFLQRPKQPPPPSTGYDRTYHMSAEGANYNTPLTIVVGGWARYAALWKAYVDANVGSVDLYSTYQGNLLRPLLGAEGDLNDHEALYFTNIWGQGYDPNGIWMSVDIDDPLTGMIYAAIVMHYWRSPVFFSGYLTTPLSVSPTGSWFNEIALEQLTFHLDSAPDLHAACGINPAATASQALASIQTCNFAGISLTSGVVTAWLGDLSPMAAPPLLHHQSLAGAYLSSAYAAGFYWDKNNPSGRVGELIFDPPAEADENEIAAVLGLAQAMAAELEAQVALEEFFVQ